MLSALQEEFSLNCLGEMKKNKLLMLLGHFFSVLAIVFLLALPRNKYEWMQQLESSAASLPIDEGSGERQIVAIIVLLCIALIQVWLLIGAETTRQRLLPLIVLIFSILMLLGKWL